MSAHDPRCRAQHMAVETDIDDLEGCDCALIADLRERIARQIELGCNHAMENGHPVACGKCLRAARIARGTQARITRGAP